MTKKQIQEMLEAIEESSSVAVHNGGLELNEWEEEFVESVREQFNEKGSLSEKQTDVLEKIYDKI